MDVERVTNHEDLARYIEALHEALVNGAEWENDTLPRFLDAMAAWVRDSPTLENASWTYFANALGAATIYE
jgi:hypothetical protein